MGVKLRYILLAALSALALSLLMGVPTAVISTPWFSRMIPTTPLDYAFLVLTSGLAGTYIALSIYRRRDSNKATGSAFAGTLGGIFAFGCPICNAVLVSLLGTSAILTYYLPLRPIIGLASVAILGVAVYLKARDRGCDTCAPDSPAQDEVMPGAHSPDMSRG